MKLKKEFQYEPNFNTDFNQLKLKFPELNDSLNTVYNGISESISNGRNTSIFYINMIKI